MPAQALEGWHGRGRRKGAVVVSPVLDLVPVAAAGVSDVAAGRVGLGKEVSRRQRQDLKVGKVVGRLVVPPALRLCRDPRMVGLALGLGVERGPGSAE